MKKLLAVCTVLLCGIIGLGFGTVFYVYKQWQQPSPLKEPILLEIPKGYGTGQVSMLLQKAGVVESARSFKWWCTFNSGKANFKTGWYAIPTDQSFEQIAALLSSGKTATIRVTIPEGRATWEVAGILANSQLKLDSAKLDALMRNIAFADSLGVKAKDLEGYLLPDTYDFPYGTDERGAIKILVRANLKLRDEMQAKNSPVWNELGDWHRILTMASVVEEETGLPQERYMVAGVFMNRFRIGMPLGADPTVRFIFRNLTGPIYKSQLASDSPYNTRRFAGLMPGPISNPGRLAIEAVLFHERTEYLYFVAKDNGTREHFFGKTLAEHNSYKDIAAKNRGEK
ncbi:MAG: endolytic transglycosylase MltG [Fibromonadales bacterium]|nr:endolytic transglycosylase MltG [Fibromonadales bacterium]